jgi:hypothetical protein
MRMIASSCIVGHALVCSLYTRNSFVELETARPRTHLVELRTSS